MLYNKHENTIGSTNQNYICIQYYAFKVFDKSHIAILRI